MNPTERAPQPKAVKEPKYTFYPMQVEQILSNMRLSSWYNAYSACTIFSAATKDFTLYREYRIPKDGFCFDNYLER